MLYGILLSLAALAGVSFGPGPPDESVPGIAGTWEGHLIVPGGSLTIVFHFSETEEGYIGTLDSPDQGAHGIPLGSVTLEGSDVVVTVPAVAGTYRGTVNKPGDLITGTWTQSGQSLPLSLSRKTTTPGPPRAGELPTGLVGAWHGVLNAGAVQLRLVVHFSDDDGVLSGSLDSPDQGAAGIPIGTINADGQSVSFQVPSVAGSYAGSITGPHTIDGRWSQSGQSLPLTLSRSDTPVEKPARPQEPTEPVPYDREDVQFDNDGDGIRLSGTLTLPRTAGPHPAAILLSGSGPQDRNESLVGHKPFLVIADYLTRRGLAVLRFDDRGVGGSTGDFATATIDAFARDAESALDYMASRADIDAARIGFIGHSEGGAVAPIVATSREGVAFLVLMAGPGVPGYDIITRQSALISSALGKSDADVNRDLAEQREILKIVMTPADDLEEVRQALRKRLMLELDAMSERDRAASGVTREAVDAQVSSLVTPWMRHFLMHDPAPVLEKVVCPVLAIIGENDLQVEPDQNLPAIRKALAVGGNEQTVVKELPGLNHLFQHSRTGSPQEYGQIEETISEDVLQLMSDWIKGAFKD